MITPALWLVGLLAASMAGANRARVAFAEPVGAAHYEARRRRRRHLTRASASAVVAE